jgi:hypothetical protein
MKTLPNIYRKVAAYGPWSIMQTKRNQWMASKYLGDDPKPVILWATTKRGIMREIRMWLN